MKILLLTLIVTLGIFLSACEDPLGYDPDVIVVPEGDNEDIGNPNALAFDAKEVRINFFEVIKSRDRGDIPCIWNNQKINVKLDTSDEYIKIWFEGDFKEKEQGNHSKERDESLSELRMKFAALLDREIIELNQSINGRKWVFARLQSKNGRNNTSIYGWQTQAWVLINSIDRVKNTIEASFFMKISTPGRYYQTQFVKAQIYIKY